MSKVIKFEKRNNVIPIDFGEFKLEFVANDVNLLKLDKMHKELVRESNESEERINDDNVHEMLEALRQLVSKAWDETFSEGTFNRVYEFAGQSVTVTVNYFVQMFEGIAEEYQDQMDTEKLKKYIED